MKVFSLQASTCKSMVMTTSARPVEKAAARHILLNGARSAPLKTAGG
jgi:hypothetical protein